MYIEKIRLQNFRNYENLEIDLNKNINIIYGENAKGKTNIIESIFLCAFGKSFRTSKEKEMIKFNEEKSLVEAFYQKKDRDGNELLLSDILGTEPDITSRKLEDEVDKTLLRNSISKLNDREKNIMEMRFGFKTGEEKTQKEVADELRNITKLYFKIRKKNNKQNEKRNCK